MIHYDNRELKDLLFSRGGSVLFTKLVMVPAILSTTFCIIVLLQPEWKVHAIMAGSVARIYATILGFVIVFRTSMALQRYFEAITHCQAMMSKWRDAYTSISVFLECSIEQFTKQGNVQVVHDLQQAKARILHWFTLLSAKACLALQGEVEDNDQLKFQNSLANRLSPHTRASRAELKSRTTEYAGTGFVVLGETTPQEQEQLRRVHDEILTIARWILLEISKLHVKKELLVAPPIQSRVYQEVNIGMLMFFSAMKIVWVPFPFQFAQFLQYALFAFFAVCPFCVLPALKVDEMDSTWFNVWALSRYWMCIPMNFLLVAGFVSLNEIAVELEEPFGSDDNDYPVYQAQWSLVWQMEDLFFADVPLDFGTNQLENLLRQCKLNELAARNYPAGKTKESVHSAHSMRVKGLSTWFEQGLQNLKAAVAVEHQTQLEAVLNSSTGPAISDQTAEIVAPLVPRFEELRDTIRESTQIVRTCGEAQSLGSSELESTIQCMLQPCTDAWSELDLDEVIRKAKRQAPAHHGLDETQLQGELQDLIMQHTAITSKLQSIVQSAKRGEVHHIGHT